MQSDIIEEILWVKVTAKDRNTKKMPKEHINSKIGLAHDHKKIQS